MKKKITQSEIASQLGVSQGTVSLALNHPESTKVAPETRKAILDFCRSRRTDMPGGNRTWNFGYLQSESTSLDMPFYHAILVGAEETAEQLGYNIIVESFRNGSANIIRRRKVDGLLLNDYALFEQFADTFANIPTVVLNMHLSHSRCDSVSPDEMHSMALAVEHLHGLGHRRIGYLGFRAPYVLKYGFFHQELRLFAFQRACERLGLSSEFQAQEFIPTPDVLQTREALTAYAARLLAMPEPPTALITGDVYAFELIRIFAARGVEVPRDISIVGIDNIDEHNRVNPFLSSIDHNFRELGLRAVEQLHERVRHPEKPFVQINCQTRLVLRQSTGPAKGE